MDSVVSIAGRHFLSFVPGMGERIEDYVIRVQDAAVNQLGSCFDVIGRALDGEAVFVRHLYRVARKGSGFRWQHGERIVTRPLADLRGD
jgi:hypothetical protein